MKQSIVGGQINGALIAGSIRYWRVWSAMDTASYLTADDAVVLWPTSGTFRRFKVKMYSALAVGESLTFTLYVNGATTATCTITEGQSTGEDLVHEVAVSPGDDVCIIADGTGATIGYSYAWWSIEFEGSIANESVVITGTTTSTLNTTYANLASNWSTFSIVEDRLSICPTAGTFKKMYVRQKAAAGVPGDAYQYCLRQDAGGGLADTSLYVPVVAPAVEGSDTSHSVVVAPGQPLTVSCTPAGIVGPPGADTQAVISMVFVADVDGESLLFGGPDDLLGKTFGNKYWIYPSCDGDSEFYQGTDPFSYSKSQTLGEEVVLKKWYVQLSAGPGDGRTFTFTMHDFDADADTTLVVSIAGASTTGNDTTHEPTIPAMDRIVIKQESGVFEPASALAYWGLVQYRVPSSSAPVITSATPDQARRNQTKNIVLAGSNFTGATDVDFGANISVNYFSIDSDAQITASITINILAALGARDVDVTGPGGIGTLTGGFTVLDVALGSGDGSYFARRAARWGIL